MTQTSQPIGPPQPQLQQTNPDLLPSADDIDAATECTIQNAPASAIKGKQSYIYALIVAALVASGALTYYFSRSESQPLSVDALVDQTMKRQF